jgi:hypothetical protein
MNKFAVLVATPGALLLTDALANQSDPSYDEAMASSLSAAFFLAAFTVFLKGQIEQYKKDRAAAARRGQAIANKLNESFKRNIK